MPAKDRAMIFDPLRKKRVVLTPEEQVRQFFIEWLNRERGFSLSLMMSEYTINFNKRKFRCDIVCFNRELRPLMIVECKAPDVKIDNSVVEQVTRYNMVLGVKYVVITNGVTTFAFAFDSQTQRYIQAGDIPHFEEA